MEIGLFVDCQPNEICIDTGAYPIYGPGGGKAYCVSAAYGSGLRLAWTLARRVRLHQLRRSWFLEQLMDRPEKPGNWI